MSGSTRAGSNPRTRVASCEPCRLSKLACDHRRPICSRCVSREISNRCFYRKNPFKRAQALASSRSRSVRPLGRGSSGFVTQSWIDRPPPAVSPAEGSESSPTTFQVRLYPNPGFQGSSSLKRVLDTLGEHPSLHGGLESNSYSWRQERVGPEPKDGVVLSMNSTVMIEEGVQILDLFLGFVMDDNLENIFQEWTGNGLELHLGAFLVRPFVNTIADEITHLQQAERWRDGLAALSQRLFDKSNNPVDVRGAMTLQDFVDQYTGPNLRWETVGVILTLIGYHFDPPYPLTLGPLSLD